MYEIKNVQLTKLCEELNWTIEEVLIGLTLANSESSLNNED